MRSLLLKIGCIVAIAGAVFSIGNRVYELTHFEETVDSIINLLQELTVVELTSETKELVRNIVLTILLSSLICSTTVLVTSILILLYPAKKKVLGIVALIFSLLGLNIISLIGSVIILIAKVPKEQKTRPAITKEEAVVI